MNERERGSVSWALSAISVGGDEYQYPERQTHVEILENI